MNEIRLITPKRHLEGIGNLRFKKHKILSKSPKAFDAALYAIHKCYLAKYTNSKHTKERGKDEDDEWAPLWSQLMGEIAGCNNQWAKVKRALCDAGYMECDNIAKHGTKSFGFRLGPLLTDTAWDYSGNVVTLPEDTRSKMEWLGIDKIQAHRIVDEIAAKKRWDSRVTKGWHTRVENFSPVYKICQTGRAYSDANQFPKRVRDTLLIDGEPTAEIDIVNCQPLLLATIYPNHSDEWRRYKELAEAGQVYETLGKFANLSRNKAKDQFIPFIFGGVRAIAEDFFRQTFPELLTAIQERRRQYREALAHELQSKESQIIVERVCGAFQAASIHDGVRVKVTEAETVEEFIKITIFEMWGLSPKITVEYSKHADDSQAA
jgi:hypothetical protein